MNPLIPSVESIEALRAALERARLAEQQAMDAWVTALRIYGIWAPESSQAHDAYEIALAARKQAQAAAQGALDTWHAAQARALGQP